MPEPVVEEEEKVAFLDEVVEKLKTIDDKTHFTEYCVLCYILALSKAEDLNNRIKPVEHVVNCFKYVNNKLNVSSAINKCDQWISTFVDNLKSNKRRASSPQKDETKEIKDEVELSLGLKEQLRLSEACEEPNM
ncbi:hypothetical protein EIN_491970 [Entamoeba invadens IP1]|uniref:Uncharacterized protein n=1 Tax=Entamoeba invadens IP1 TaxID=370355 RepID=A0A0A1U409_ENTIV|nr:hypothetical protein EIN_491970 [Entamoeba invadens IP1]ELP88978.1 hypothetical protein EIN_491970 [Entamoeba invadens IP1]|eukprot:XP_004255749.1 hypothetical protein EIN_491970 [Entamoeba invadens IP1]